MRGGIARVAGPGPAVVTAGTRGVQTRMLIELGAALRPWWTLLRKAQLPRSGHSAWCVNQELRAKPKCMKSSPFLYRLYVHNGGVKYGYARVSTDGQSVDARVRQVTKAGCAKGFRETASGAKTDRAQL